MDTPFVEPNEQPDGAQSDADLEIEIGDGAPTKPSRFLERYDWASTLIFTVVFMIALFAFVVRTNEVFGISMVPSLRDGDILLVSRVGMGPNYGDVVVITKPSDAEKTLIKRVIATEGQVVDIDFTAGLVYVDGVALDEPYTNTPTNLRLDTIFPLTVPDGHVFVMGDNRNSSMDSRDASVGTVDTRYILGRVVIRIMPFDTFGAVDHP